MNEETCRKLLKLGHQKAILEAPGNSDLMYHFRERVEIHHRIGKLLYNEITPGKTQKQIISEASDFFAQNFPDVAGFSKTSIWRMIFTYRKYKDDRKLEKISKEVPVSQSVVIATMCKTQDECRTVLEYEVYNKF